MTDTTARAQGVSITIKTGKGYDDTWLGFTGNVSSVQMDIIETFGLVGQEGLTLYEIVANATQVAHGVTRAVTALKGTVIPSTPKPDEAQQVTHDQAPAQEEDPYDLLMQQINADNISIDTLRHLYADNTEMFTADTDQARAAKKAWKARGKALQSAS